MARIRVCSECRKPVAECICDDDGELVSLNPDPPISYDGPIHDADG